MKRRGAFYSSLRSRDLVLMFPSKAKEHGPSRSVRTESHGNVVYHGISMTTAQKRVIREALIANSTYVALRARNHEGTRLILLEKVIGEGSVGILAVMPNGSSSYDTRKIRNPHLHGRSKDWIGARLQQAAWV